MNSFLRIVLTTASTLILCVALWCPAPASADLYVLLQEGHNGPATDRRPKPPLNEVPSVRLNDTGDLAIRYQRATLTIAYTPVQTALADETGLLLQAQATQPPIPGISLALSITF